MMRITFLFFVFYLLIIMHAPAQSDPANGDTTSSQGIKKQNEIKIKWYTFEEAVKINRTAFPKRKIFIDVYTDWCGWCKRMDKETFANSYIANYLQEHFLPVKLDGEGSDTIYFNNQMFVNPNPGGKKSPHQLAVLLLNRNMTYPSVVLLNEYNQMLTVVNGFMNVKDMEVVLTFFAENRHFEMPWEKYKANFKGKASP